MTKRHDVMAWANHARKKKRRFVRLGARACEETLLQLSGSDVSQFFRQRDHVLVGK